MRVREAEATVRVAERELAERQANRRWRLAKTALAAANAERRAIQRHLAEAVQVGVFGNAIILFTILIPIFLDFLSGASPSFLFFIYQRATLCILQMAGDS